jgi:hypothetical protein
VIFARPGRKQDEGDFTAIFPLTLTLSRRERENNVHYLLVGSVKITLEEDLKRI